MVASNSLFTRVTLWRGFMIGQVLLGLFLAPPALAQLDGPGSTGVSASLIRLFGTNNAFTAEAVVQVLGGNNQEHIATPISFTLTDNKIRVEVDMNQMRNLLEPNALAQVKPLGLDQVVSIIQPQQKTTLVAFPKLKAFVKLAMPPEEAEAFMQRAKIARTAVAKEKMEGHPCLKQRVVITDNAGKKSEATVWTATDLRDFPVCVATKEKEGTVVIRFRKIEFGRAPAAQFEPPAGYGECADMQVLMAGPVVKFMKDNHTALKATSKSQPASSSARKTSPPAASKKK